MSKLGSLCTCADSGRKNVGSLSDTLWVEVDEHFRNGKKTVKPHASTYYIESWGLIKCLDMCKVVSA